MKKSLKVFAVIIVSCLIYAGGYAVGVDDTNRNLFPPVNSAGTKLTQDPVLIADAKQLGIDYSNVNISFAPDLSAPDVVGAPVVGTFLAPNSIQIKTGLSKQDELQAVAYEFMHFYWLNSPADSKQQMATTYQKYYDSNYTFQQATKFYVGTPDILADDRNSTACTVMPPYVLTNELNNYCDKFIPNRSILF